VTRRSRSVRAASFEDWDFWWAYNRDGYLNLKANLYERKLRVESESSAFFFGRQTSTARRDRDRPTPEFARARLVPRLLEALESEDSEARESACLSLGKVGQAREVGPLVARLKDNVKDVREHAVIGLGLLRAKEGIPCLLAVLEGGEAGRALRGRKPEYRLRAFAAASLGLIGDNAKDEVKAALMKVSADRSVNRNVSVNGTIGLGLLVGDNQYVHAIIEHLMRLAAAGPRVDPWIRAHAVVALGRIHQRNGLTPDPKTIGAMIKWLRHDKTSHVRRSAAIGLGMLIRDPDAFPAVVHGLEVAYVNAKDNQTRNFTAIALGQIGGEAAYKILTTDVARARGQKRVYAALGLGILCRGVLGDPEWAERRQNGLGLIRKVFRSTRASHLRGGHAIALGIAQDGEAGSMLLDALKQSRDPDLRGYLAVALGMVNHTPAVARLGALLGESKNIPILQLRATIGLGLMGAREFIPALVKSLRNASSCYMLCSKARALGYIGDRTAVPTLVDIVNDEDTQAMIQGFAISAIGNIADPEPVPLVSRITTNHNYLASTECLNSLLAIL